MKLTIGIDGDGVIFDYVQGLRESFPAAANSPGPFTYNMVEDGWFPSKQHWLDAHHEVMARCHDLPLNDTSSAEAVDRLRTAGHRVVLATARSPKYEAGTIANLALHGIEVDDVIHTGYSVSKTTLSLDVLIEDKPDTIRELLTTSIRPVMYLQPYNENEDLAVDKVRTMNEFADLLLH